MSHANQLLIKALGSCRDAEVSEEVVTEVNLAQPDQRSFQSGIGLRVNIDGKIGFTWSEGELPADELISKAAQSSMSGPRGTFSQKGLFTPGTDNVPQEAAQRLEESIVRFQAVIQELDFMLPSLFPDRHFSLSARILRHTLKLTTRSGERSGERMLHLLTLKSGDSIPVGASVCTTSAGRSSSDLLCSLMWRAAHSHEVAWAESSVVPVVFMPCACGRLLEEFVSDMLNADSPQSVSVPLHVPWLSPSVNISDDGTLPGGFGSVSFDGEGLTKRRTPLIVQGRAENLLCDIRNARARGIAPAGQAVRSWASPPRPGYANLCMDAGSYSLGELCSAAGYGILADRLTPLPSHMKKSGQFAGRCETAFIVYNGRPICRAPQYIIRADYSTLLGSGLMGVGGTAVLNGRTQCPPIAVRAATLEEADIDPAETWSDYPELWW